MASPFGPEQYLPFLDVGWSDLSEILQYGDFQGDPWDTDIEKPFANLAKPESCTLMSQPLLRGAAPLPMLNPQLQLHPAASNISQAQHTRHTSPPLTAPLPILDPTWLYP